MINTTLKAKVDALTYEEQDDVYRYLWSQHVREDVESHANDIDADLTKEEIDKVVEMYVYQGKYECNIDYWSNIENLIDYVIKDRRKGD